MKTDDHKKTHLPTVFPQAEDIPQPLEIHPSIDPEFARGLLAACEHLDVHPEEFCMAMSEMVGRIGCIICHVEKLSN